MDGTNSIAAGISFATLAASVKLQIGYFSTGLGKHFQRRYEECLAKIGPFALASVRAFLIN